MDLHKPCHAKDTAKTPDVLKPPANINYWFWLFRPPHPSPHPMKFEK